MNIAAGLAALDEYYKEGDRRQVREHQQALRDAERSVLPDRTNAERSGYQLRDSQNQANSQLLPQQTANQRARLGLESSDLAGQAERQPVEQQTKNVNAQIGLATANNTQQNLPNEFAATNATSKAKAMTADAQLKQLPQKLAMAATQGAIDAQGQADVVLGTLGQLISRQDKASALSFANEVAKNGDLLPGTNGKTFTDIVPVRGGPKGDGYNFITADGQTMFAPVEAIGGAMQKMKSGKYHFLHTADGAVYSGNETTGTVQQVQAPNKDLIRRAGGQHTPAEVQSAEWLMANVPKYKNNPEAAWDAVRSSKEKTRSSFIMDYVSKNAMPGADTMKLQQDAGRIYDTLRQTQGGGVGATSNTPLSDTVDPTIKSLIGIP